MKKITVMALAAVATTLIGTATAAADSTTAGVSWTKKVTQGVGA